MLVLRITSFLALLIATPLLASACGDDDGADGGLELPADQALARSADALADADSFRLAFEGTVGVEGEGLDIPALDSLPGEETAFEGEGAVLRPDRARLDVDVDVGPIALPATVVRVGDDLYVEALGQAVQVEAPAGQARLLDPGALAQTALGWVEDPVETGSESRDGVATVRIEGSVDGEAVSSALGGLLGDGALTDAVSEGTVVVWVGADDLLPRRIEVDYTATTEQAGAEGAVSLTLEADLSDYGDEVTIEAPEGARPLELDDLPGLLGP
ncbi:MAG: LppX_LprAFG lipoprotein [Miltoncostaeaceae bacterium]